METTASSTGKEMRACSQETDGALPGLGRGLEIIAATSNMLMLSFNMHKLSHVSFMVDKLATETRAGTDLGHLNIAKPAPHALTCNSVLLYAQPAYFARSPSLACNKSLVGGVKTMAVYCIEDLLLSNELLPGSCRVNPLL
eukprot:5520577-Pleurochrysis_carterae.AAC.3